MRRCKTPSFPFWNKVVNRFLLLFSVTLFITCASNVFAQAVAEQETKPAAAEKATTRLGIVTEEPKEKPFVKIDGGYMVPYTTKIPGTEIEFTMMPIQGGKFTMGSPDDEDDRLDDEGPQFEVCLLYTSPSPRDQRGSRMPSSA